MLRLEKGTKEHYRHYLAERERAVCVCVKPANRHAGKSLQIEVSGQFYMFTRGAGCPCQYQPNEEACM